LVSLVSMSWYSISGADVAGDPLDATATGGTVILVEPEVGSHHPLWFWVSFGLCAVAAGLAALPRTWVSTVACVVAPVLAGVLILGAVEAIGVASLAVGNLPPPQPSGIDLSVEPGIWVTIAGLVLVATSVIVGPRRTATTA
jgi:hypothetical protein